MAFKKAQQMNARRYARNLLVLFVLSWMNMSFQLPVHAAMMQPAISAAHQMMDHEMMAADNCVCPPVLCDVILASGSQTNEGLAQQVDITSITMLTLIAVHHDAIKQPQALSIFSHADLFALQTGFPPPLQSIILII